MLWINGKTTSLLINLETSSISTKSFPTAFSYKLFLNSWLSKSHHSLTIWEASTRKQFIHFHKKIKALSHVVQISFLNGQKQYDRRRSWYWDKTNTYNFIFASASLNLTIASSCLTVIGIAAASPVSFACCLMSYNVSQLSNQLSKAKLFCSKNFIAGRLRINWNWKTQKRLSIQSSIHEQINLESEIFKAQANLSDFNITILQHCGCRLCQTGMAFSSTILNIPAKISIQIVE